MLIAKAVYAMYQVWCGSLGCKYRYLHDKPKSSISKTVSSISEQHPRRRNQRPSHPTIIIQLTQLGTIYHSTQHTTTHKQKCYHGWPPQGPSWILRGLCFMLTNHSKPSIANRKNSPKSHPSYWRVFSKIRRCTLDRSISEKVSSRELNLLARFENWDHQISAT